MDENIVKKFNQLRYDLIGKEYRHFKGKIIKIKDVAMDTETLEIRIIYYDLTNKNILWDRPYEMFISKVDKEKYPDATQEYRFELIDKE